MTSKYRETLNRWAERHVPAGAKVVHVQVENDPGYHYSSYTFEDPHVDVTISYRPGEYSETGYVTIQPESLGDILTELFKIEDQEA